MKHKKIKHTKPISTSALMAIPFIGNPLIVLVASFVSSVMLDPVAITFFSKSWVGNFSERLYNFSIAMFVGMSVWLLVWIGTKYTEPVLYAPIWGLFYFVAAVVMPLIITNGWRQVTPSMWFFVTVGILSFAAFVLLAIQNGMLNK